MADFQALRDQLSDAGVRIVATLPDDWVAPLIEAIDADDRFHHVAVARETEIVGICAGAYFAGVNSAAIMGMAGILAITHEVATLNLMHDIPFLVLTSMRGQPDEAPHTVYQVVQGRIGKDVMDAIEMYHWPVTSEEPVDLRDAVRYSRYTKRPVAVSFSKESLADLAVA